MQCGRKAQNQAADANTSSEREKREDGLTIDNGDIHIPKDTYRLLERHHERSAEVDLHQLH